MKHFDLLRFSALISRITFALDSCRDAKCQGEVVISDLTRFVDIARDTATICSEIGFEDCAYKANSLLMRLKGKPNVADFSGMHIEMLHLHEGIILDMRRHNFLQMEKSQYFEKRGLLGDEVWDAFPKAQEDILDAGSCLAVNLNTAAVFHLMHVVEWGLRAFCLDLHMSEIVDDRKANRTIPIEYAVWEKILNQLQSAIDARVLSIQDKHEKQIAQIFYYPVLKEIAGFKEAWRNHVMHTRASYNSETALAVKSHVERFMKHLVSYGIKEAI